MIAPSHIPIVHALLAVHGLAKNFVGVRALSGVDITIRRGSVHGLIGPNGSGKSTFINVVTGVFRPSAGKITLFGYKDLPPLGPHQSPLTESFARFKIFACLASFR